MNVQNNIVIPRYRIEREIGHGGMATVYLAIQESLNRPVALKVMASALAADRNFGERFLREAHTVGKLNHPHIVAIYDVGVSDHNHYIAMEYVDGGDLKQRQKSGKISVDEALRIISQIASALGYAHGKGFVHRDIKPENILFREDGSAVLSDFGIAKAVDSATRMTGTGMSIGTPHYMSPEQAQGKDEIDGRSDLYSLGILLYEMLTGKVPYEADNTIGVAMQHVQAPIPELPSNLSKYQPLLDHLLAKQAGQRYQNASELIQAVDQLKSGTRLQRPVHATKVMASHGIASSDSVKNVSPRSDGLKWGLGGALLAVLVGVGIYMWQKNKLPANFRAGHSNVSTAETEAKSGSEQKESGKASDYEKWEGFKTINENGRTQNNVEPIMNTVTCSEFSKRITSVMRRANISRAKFKEETEELTQMAENIKGPCEIKDKAFFGPIKQTIECKNGVFYFKLAGYENGFVVSDEITTKYRSQDPNQGQMVIGLKAAPYFCIVSSMPLVIFPGALVESFTFH